MQERLKETLLAVDSFNEMDSFPAFDNVDIETDRQGGRRELRRVKGDSISDEGLTVGWVCGAGWPEGVSVGQIIPYKQTTGCFVGHATGLWRNLKRGGDGGGFPLG